MDGCIYEFLKKVFFSYQVISNRFCICTIIFLETKIKTALIPVNFPFSFIP